MLRPYASNMPSSSSQSSAAPTVVVARRVRPDSQEEFRAWDWRIRAVAASYPGYLGSEVQPPNTSHPGEWVTVYSFATADELEAWLQSDERREFMVEVAGMIDGEAREQHVAGMRAAQEPVTVVFSQIVEPGNRDEFVALYDDAVEHLSDFSGFLGSELLDPVEGVQVEYVIVASFASRMDLDRWLESDTRRQWVDRIEQLIEGDRTYNVVGGFGGWFPAQALQPEGPKRWKQAIAVFIALFPTVLLITLVRGAIFPNMNVVLAVFVGNVLGILALTYVLMPPLTHRLRHWLSR